MLWQPPTRALIVSGRSNAAKSTFCRWLASEHGFEHVNCDRRDIDAIRDPGLRTEWNTLESGNGAPLAARLHDRAPIVIDWSYDPNGHCLSMVRHAIVGGIPCWWFHADLVAARDACIRRAQGDLGGFDQQAMWIGVYLSDLKRVYGWRFLETLGPSDTQLMRHERIWAGIRVVETIERVRARIRALLRS